jgi:diguanylate cyclase (GGDEF)-like protein
MFVDLDHFKPINDAAGHAAGDDALRQVAQLLEEEVRQSDTVARMGGDEFAILLPGCSLRRAQSIAEKVRSAIEMWRLERRGKVFRIGASIGIVELTPGLMDVAAVLHAADTACYQAKHAGRNRVMVYVPSASGTSTRPSEV